MKTQNEVHKDDKLMWESFVSREADDDTSRIPHDVDSFGTDESDADQHAEYMMDQDLLIPLHKAAQDAGAKDINDWIIKQIKDQGENWTSWFINTVIKGDS